MTPILIHPPSDPLTPSTVADLARSCHADSVANGWWEPLEYAAKEAAREAMRADLIGSEVGEALDALRRPERPLAYLDDKGKPDGYLVEVADTAIRALDLLGRVAPRLDTDHANKAIHYGQSHLSTDQEPGKWQHRVWHVLNRNAANPDDWGTVRRCAWIVFLCDDECTRHNADILQLITLKRDYNRTRGTRHGGLSV
jgi:hypothetical protein